MNVCNRPACRKALWLVIALLAPVWGRGALTAEGPGSAQATEERPFALDRDPFRPVGYVLPSRRPQEIDAPPEPERPEPTIEWPALRPSGFSRTPDGTRMVFIAGGWYQTGDRVERRRGEWIFSWRIEDIEDGALRLRRETVRSARTNETRTR